MNMRATGRGHPSRELNNVKEGRSSDINGAKRRIRVSQLTRPKGSVVPEDMIQQLALGVFLMVSRNHREGCPRDIRNGNGEHIQSKAEENIANKKKVYNV